ncbi:hypothetical protein LINPERHAP1_LOCUS20770 [Linum perenne]
MVSPHHFQHWNLLTSQSSDLRVHKLNWYFLIIQILLRLYLNRLMI